MDEEHWNNEQKSKDLKWNVLWRNLIKPMEYLKTVGSLSETDKILHGYRREARSYLSLSPTSRSQPSGSLP